MLKGMAANEESALAAFTAGDEAGLAFLFRVYYPVLVVFACKFTSKAIAEEIVNEAFYKIWEKRSMFNSLSHFRSYLYKIVYHDCLKAKQVAIPDELPSEAIDAFDYNAELIKSETLRHLYQAIESLPAQCKAVFTQLYVEGKTVRETADEMGIAVSTVKAQKARGLVLLKAKLGTIEPGMLLLSFFLLR
ncbi:RNA polymerase sigma-70 factor (ECF subfamily) [Lacibacter cauensis]|uniref:RNA polymerase sigma-70 factor (ECF subfamily) n=1 Tax=Lacibacter cauensis TaxID=510947 RepID=A0A562SPQ4_9BACT|nr:sigma-70 family RNA polymerase sigma factor [Lacibacter cauensis]TWI83267.1 RNA polymerase sigma-70 factor (ECF subfamily) [Lacibacter cauensis]